MQYLFILIVLSFCCACGGNESDHKYEQRNENIEKRERELLQKEQELLIKEKALLLKEKQLSESQRTSDSLINNVPDTLMSQYAEISGRWNVNMRCIETDCIGSAVGDVKNEQWQIKYENQSILVRAFSGDSLVRVYTGTKNDKSIELVSTAATNTKMVVKIQNVQKDKLFGQREIIRAENCHIVYSIELDKL